jgi:divalent metal cation (Fe/Co/Zn/Cd) transporter
MAAAIVVGVGVMRLKFREYRTANSSAVLCDAPGSIINVVVAVLAFGSLLVSAKPPDETHPYGHGKIEFFSAGFGGALITLAAAGVFLEGVWQVFGPQTLSPARRKSGQLRSRHCMRQGGEKRKVPRGAGRSGELDR